MNPPSKDDSRRNAEENKRLIRKGSKPGRPMKPSGVARTIKWNRKGGKSK